MNLKSILNKETLLYLIFGILTTAVNYIVFWLCYNIIMDGKGSLYANAVAFSAAVIFAFLVNKAFVFESKSWSLAVLKKEIPPFIASRIGSFCIEEVGLFIAEKLLKWNEAVVLTLGEAVIDGVTVVKLALAFVVVIINYAFCKLFIFKK